LFKSIMWGSMEFDSKVISIIPKPDGLVDNRYLVSTQRFVLLKVSDCHRAMLDIMLDSGGYRYATESEVKHWRVVKECELYR